MAGGIEDQIIHWETHLSVCNRGSQLAREALARLGVTFPNEDQPTEEIPIVTPEMLREAGYED